MRSAIVAVIFTAFLLGPTLAEAQSDDELAKRYYKLGEELYNRSDYEGALKQFQQSYQLSKKPALLFNMARCQESLGQHQKAIDLLTEYLATNPENRAVIEARIANLRRLVEERKKQQPAAVPPPPARPAEPAVTPPPSPTEPTNPPPAAPSRSRPLRLPGWIGVGVGGALLVATIALGVVAQNKSNDLEEARKSGKEWSAVSGLADSQRKYRNAAIGTGIAAGVVAVTGAVLLILDARSASRERRSAWIAPSLGPQQAGLCAGMRF